MMPDTATYGPILLTAWAILATLWALRTCSVCADLAEQLRDARWVLANTLRTLGAERRSERQRELDRQERQRRTLQQRKRSEGERWN